MSSSLDVEVLKCLGSRAVDVASKGVRQVSGAATVKLDEL
jgi:hypothetical protein